jgi:hypothetical protein
MRVWMYLSMLYTVTVTMRVWMYLSMLCTVTVTITVTITDTVSEYRVVVCGVWCVVCVLSVLLTRP